MSKPPTEVENLKKYSPLGKNPFSKKSSRVVKAVDNVLFRISESECSGLMDESGSGKFTASRCVPNLLCPTNGKACFDGKSIFNEEKGIALNRKGTIEYRRKMRIIFRDPNASLDPRMTVGRIVEEGIKKHKIAIGREASSLAAYCLELCGLDRSMVSRYPGQFSGEQKQCIGVARALAVGLRFVMVDEPLSTLDVFAQSQALNLMNELREKLGLAYLYISYDLKTVKYFCDKVGVLYLGTLFEIGTTKETVIEPLHPYTKALFSVIPPEDPTASDNPGRIKLIGEVPSATNVPSSCKFHIRCPYTIDKCKSTEPQLACAGGIHFVTCHHWQEVSHKQSRKGSRKIIDPRFKEITSAVMCHSLEIQPGERVIISAVDDGDKSAETLVEEVHTRGAVPFVGLEQTAIRRTILRGATAEQLEPVAKSGMVLMNEVDRHVTTSVPYNSCELYLISQGKQTMHTKYYKGLISRAKSKLCWVFLIYPNHGMVQNAGMSLSGFPGYCFDLMTMDYDKSEKASLPMALCMRTADRMRIVTSGTDLTVSLKGLTALIAAGEHSPPDGEIASAPDRCSVNGTISFNVLSMRNDFLFIDMRLTFKDGKVVKVSTNDAERFLKETSLDEGCRYIGEFPMGTRLLYISPSPRDQTTSLS